LIRQGPASHSSAGSPSKADLSSVFPKNHEIIKSINSRRYQHTGA